MYIPNAFRVTDGDSLVAFMREYSFATLISVIDGTPFATHLPIVVRAEGETVTLVGHLARANPHWRAFGQGESLAIFHGPHAYISTKHYHATENVPTWNYIAVHAYGVPQIITADDPDATAAMLGAMFDAFEPAYAARWEALPQRYRDGMLRGIVGFELPVTRLEGKAKLSQNRDSADQQSVAAALHGHPDQAVAGIAAAMETLLGARAS